METQMALTKQVAVSLSIKELNDAEALKQTIINNLSCPYDLLKEYYFDPEPLKNQLDGYFMVGDLGINITYYPYKKKSEKRWVIFGGYGLKTYKSIAPLLKHIEKYRNTMENWSRK